MGLELTTLRSRVASSTACASQAPLKRFFYIRGPQIMNVQRIMERLKKYKEQQ